MCFDLQLRLLELVGGEKKKDLLVNECAAHSQVHQCVKNLDVGLFPSLIVFDLSEHLETLFFH